MSDKFILSKRICFMANSMHSMILRRGECHLSLISTALKWDNSCNSWYFLSFPPFFLVSLLSFFSFQVQQVQQESTFWIFQENRGRRSSWFQFLIDRLFNTRGFTFLMFTRRYQMFFAASASNTLVAIGTTDFLLDNTARSFSVHS